ncbi:hypothetical protein HWQ46_21690 [Shewanella sp. D64]|uniref:hypothetical protein n=1 Tax=unclassified Shewanella TaxID=196818 RepID=UPI0022BA1247|nr:MULTISPECIES: hypothetical protein [unclassified Shewanella]MEC4728153.1 hypothetical protein [Shewanella sp. D64]MEC4740273.1 hypothetical protein [Shewanella sp. E94]WBJ94410.1 hypothetical protein HWQ47_21460 [Shewanella sp. MTB7]
MTPALIEQVNQSVEPSACASAFFLRQHWLYMGLAQHSVDRGMRRCATDYFNVACCYLRLALQKAV